MMQRVKFGWPPKELSPNARIHWAKKAKVAKQYRRDCFLLAKIDRVSVDWEGPIAVKIEFRPPSKQHYDLDGCISRLKAGLDGLADALGVNDRRFQIRAAMGNPEPLGAVLIDLCRT